MCLSFTVHTSGFETASLCVLLTGSVNPQQRRVIGCVSPSKMVLVLSPSGFLSVNSHFSRSNMIQSQDVFLASRDEAHYSSFPDLNGRVSLSLSIYLSICLSFFRSFCLHCHWSQGLVWFASPPSLFFTHFLVGQLTILDGRCWKKIRQLSAWLMRTSRKSEKSQWLLSILKFH